jgi:uncharacterized protein (TIGR00369 family)
MAEFDQSKSEQFANLFLDNIRHCGVLDLSVAAVDERSLTLMLPYQEKIIGNPLTGVIHSGALSTLMDTALGLAVPLILQPIELCPTLDLRIDYMGVAEPGKAVYGRAEVYRITEHVVFARGTAFHEDLRERPIAHCVATFMRLGERLKKKKQSSATQP